MPHMKKENAKIGNVKLADDVVTRIAGMAALDVEGVSSVAGNMTRQNLPRVNRKSLNKGVKVLMGQGRVVVDLSLLLEYGYHIPDTCRAVQEKVKSSILNMTDIRVDDVNVHIAGITMPNA